ncbi:hypothetical protein Esti_004727 [Eimeria stiedai]
MLRPQRMQQQQLLLLLLAAAAATLQLHPAALLLPLNLLSSSNSSSSSSVSLLAAAFPYLVFASAEGADSGDSPLSSSSDAGPERREGVAPAAGDNSTASASEGLTGRVAAAAGSEEGATAAGLAGATAGAAKEAAAGSPGSANESTSAPPPSAAAGAAAPPEATAAVAAGAGEKLVPRLVRRPYSARQGGFLKVPQSFLERRGGDLQLSEEDIEKQLDALFTVDPEQVEEQSAAIARSVEASRTPGHPNGRIILAVADLQSPDLDLQQLLRKHAESSSSSSSSSRGADYMHLRAEAEAFGRAAINGAALEEQHLVESIKVLPEVGLVVLDFPSNSSEAQIRETVKSIWIGSPATWLIEADSEVRIRETPTAAAAATAAAAGAADGQEESEEVEQVARFRVDPPSLRRRLADLDYGRSSSSSSSSKSKQQQQQRSDKAAARKQKQQEIKALQAENKAVSKRDRPSSGSMSSSSMGSSSVGSSSMSSSSMSSSSMSSSSMSNSSKQHGASSKAKPAKASRDSTGKASKLKAQQQQQEKQQQQQERQKPSKQQKGQKLKAQQQDGDSYGGVSSSSSPSQLGPEPLGEAYLKQLQLPKAVVATPEEFQNSAASPRHLAAASLPAAAAADAAGDHFGELEVEEDEALVEKRELFLENEDEAPNDLFFQRQWALTHPTLGCKLPAAWRLVYRRRQQQREEAAAMSARGAAAEAASSSSIRSSEAEPIIVAVIDTGVDYTHEDLRGRLWKNTAEVPNNGVDDDGNGYVDDYHGYDFEKGSSDPMDQHGHGTHVAGIVAASANNGIGVAGANWRVKLMPLKFEKRSSAAVEAIAYSLQMGAKVSTNSWGFSFRSEALRLALEQAETKGQLFVSAVDNAGADNTTAKDFPPNWGYDWRTGLGFKNVLRVANLAPTGKLSVSSNYGKYNVDIAAPGTDIISTLPGRQFGDKYGYKSGTSMATPLVAGIAAMVWGERPSLTAAEVREVLLATASPLAALKNRVASQGLVDAKAAIELVHALNKRDAGIDSPEAEAFINYQQQQLHQQEQLQQKHHQHQHQQQQQQQQNQNNGSNSGSNGASKPGGWPSSQPPAAATSGSSSSSSSSSYPQYPSLPSVLLPLHPLSPHNPYYGPTPWSYSPYDTSSGYEGGYGPNAYGSSSNNYGGSSSSSNYGSSSGSSNHGSSNGYSSSYGKAKVGGVPSSSGYHSSSIFSSLIDSFFALTGFPHCHKPPPYSLPRPQPVPLPACAHAYINARDSVEWSNLTEPAAAAAAKAQFAGFERSLAAAAAGLARPATSAAALRLEPRRQVYRQLLLQSPSSRSTSRLLLLQAVQRQQDVCVKQVQQQQQQQQ